jgi:uncharacterized membrane protein
MKTRLLNLWETVRTSFWFIPGLMVLSAIGLSLVMVAADRRTAAEPSWVLGLLYTGGPEGTRSILSTIAGSMITVAGVTFSITIVALALTSSQFGPRLLRNFMKDKGNQVVLGTFIATFIYCLLILRSVDTTGRHIFVPYLSVSFAVLLALANVGVLIYFIHHVSTSIHADRVIEAVYRELLEHIQALFPEEHGHRRWENGHGGVEPRPGKEGGRPVHSIKVAQAGYLQAIDRDGLMALAVENDILLSLPHRPGEYIITGGTLAEIQCVEQPDERLAERIAGSLIVGPQRTPEQDAEYAVRQLVEIAVRALSPGINDPFTAISCIDRLGSALCYMAGRAFPSPYHFDDGGTLRLIAKHVTYAGVTNAAFDQIRQYGRSSAAVTIRLLETLTAIAIHARDPEQRQAILRQGSMVARTGREALPEENDRQDVHDRYQGLLEALDQGGKTDPRAA